MLTLNYVPNRILLLQVFASASNHQDFTAGQNDDLKRCSKNQGYTTVFMPIQHHPTTILVAIMRWNIRGRSDNNHRPTMFAGDA